MENKIGKIGYGVSIEPVINRYIKEGLSIDESKRKALKEEKERILQSIISYIKAHELIKYSVSEDGRIVEGVMDICIDNDNFPESEMIGKYFRELSFTDTDDNIEIVGKKSTGIIKESDKSLLEQLGWNINGNIFERPKRKDTIIKKDYKPE
ncbi:hypothetical protein [Dysgonomonas capnocytophagoides]|uniref:hypothetical protein n=1 Tax=Dysgonomonas capnocytophagoides TaxID=45254 RepID=UPI0029212F4A|nr:hypothetical protein DCPSUM001_33600 [Dysgonomonas capnocytophagoides]